MKIIDVIGTVFHTCDKCKYEGYGFKDCVESEISKESIGARVLSQFTECPECGYKEID